MWAETSVPSTPCCEGKDDLPWRRVPPAGHVPAWDIPSVKLQAREIKSYLVKLLGFERCLLQQQSLAPPDRIPFGDRTEVKIQVGLRASGLYLPKGGREPPAGGRGEPSAPPHLGSARISLKPQPWAPSPGGPWPCPPASVPAPVTPAVGEKTARALGPGGGQLMGEAWEGGRTPSPRPGRAFGVRNEGGGRPLSSSSRKRRTE